MTDKRKITRDLIAATPWGEAYLREMDLIIAVNEFASACNRTTLFNDWLDRFVAERCAPLDGGLELKRLPNVDVPDGAGASDDYVRVRAALEFLKELPRGNWAVLQVDGKYDAYMSDGYGGIGTESGYKFTKNSPDAPAFNGTAMYGHVLSMMTYLRRNQIVNRIMDHTFNSTELKPGQVFKNITVMGKVHSKVQFVGIVKGYFSGGGDAVEVTAIRRGVKPKNVIIEGRDFAARIGATPVMPPEFVDAGNAMRLIPEFRPKPDKALEVEMAGPGLSM